MNSNILPGRQQNDIAQRCRTYNQHHHSAEQPIQQDTHCNPFDLVDLGNGQVCSCRIFFELRLTMLGQRHNFCKSFVVLHLGNGQVCNLNKPSYPSLLDICLMNKKHILPIYPQKTKLYQQHTPHKISCPIFCCIYRVCTEDKMPPRAYLDGYPMGRQHNSLLRLTMIGQQHNFCNPFVLVDLGNGQICSLNKMPPRAYLDVYPMGRLHNFGRTSPPFPKIGLWRTGYMTIPHWHPHC